MRGTLPLWVSTFRAFVNGAGSTTAFSNVAAFQRDPGMANGVARAWAVVGTVMSDAMRTAAEKELLPPLPRNVYEPPKDGQLELRIR